MEGGEKKNPKTKTLCAHKLTYMNIPISPKVKAYSNPKIVSGQFRNKINSYITHNPNIFPRYFPTSKSKGFTNTFAML